MNAKLKVWILAALLIFGVTFSAQAASFKLGDAGFNLGGSVRYDVGYQFNDFGDMPLANASAVPGDLLYMQTLPENSNTDFFCDDPGDSRVNLLAKYGDVTGFVEFGFGSNLIKRHAFLSYDFGGGNSLLVGQTWSAFALHFPSQVLNDDDSLIGFGNIYSGRNAQVRFTHQGPISYILAIEDNSSSSAGLTASRYVENQLTPKLIASVTYKNDLLWVTPSVVWQNVEMKGNAYGAPGTGLVYDDVEMEAYALAIDGGITIAKIGFDYGIWTGQNVGVILSDRGVPVANYLGAGLSDGIEDVNSRGGWAQFSIPVEPVTVRVGASFQQTDVEIANPAEAYKYDDTIERSAMFINAKYNVTKQFFVQPELAYFCFGDNPKKIDRAGYIQGDQDLGSSIFAGVHFQYDF